MRGRRHQDHPPRTALYQMSSELADGTIVLSGLYDLGLKCSGRIVRSEKNGGEVVLAPLVPGRSTTSILERGGAGARGER